MQPQPQTQQLFKFLPTEKIRPDYSFLSKVITLYSEFGVGKTTALAKIGALILDTQKGTKAHEAYVVPIKSWQDMLDVQKELLTTQNKFDIVGIDLASDAFKFLEDHICKANNVAHMSDLAYGKGYSLFKEAVYKFTMEFIKSNKTVIFVAHAKEKLQKTKVQEITVMQSNLSAAAQELIFGLSDFVFYAYVSSEGKRVMRTRPHKHVLCKDRFNVLPEVMELDLLKVKELLEQSNNQQKGEKK
jgi:hypothetical protein